MSPTRSGPEAGIAAGACERDNCQPDAVGSVLGRRLLAAPDVSRGRRGEARQGCGTVRVRDADPFFTVPLFISESEGGMGMGKLRNVTREEAERWIELARQHGAVNEKGEIGVGRFKVTGEGDGWIELKFFTPLVAEDYTEDLKRKTPPIMFNRNERGEILIPGRWWADWFEHAAVVPDAPLQTRTAARHLSRHAVIEDVALPADTDTISFEMPDENGHFVIHEALPPGGHVIIRLQRNR